MPSPARGRVSGMTEVLTTERLTLRPWKVGDADETRVLFSLASNPHIGPRAGWPAHRSVEDSAAIIRGVLSTDETYAVVLSATGEPVGSIGLKPLSGIIAPSAEENRGALEIGYWIGEPYWGRGLVPEAARELMRYGFEDLGLEAIWGTHDVNNKQSSRVMDKLGLRIVRTRDHVYFPLIDEYHDEAIRRITRAQWEHER
ncbi:GNAT family N-acetyltransferase [Bifidobacterium merycicum]